MELGGNAPLIVFEDADLDQAVKGAMLAKMRNLGEACTAANRIYVHADVAEAFTDKLVAAMAALKVGNGLEDGVDVGPLVNADTRDKVAAFVADAVDKGATLRLGGEAPEGPGFFYPPTVLTDVPETAECVHDEIFGPVAALQTFTRPGRRDPPRQRHRVRPGRLRLLGRLPARPAGGRAARLRHGGPQPRPRLRPGGALRRHQAVGPRPRGRPRGHARVHGDAVHLGGVVSMGEVIASPAVRAHAGRRGVDIETLGRELGRETIAREDVDRKAEGGAAPAPAAGRDYWDVDHAAWGPVEEEPLPRLARLAAQNLAAAQARIPAVTHHDRADMRAVEALRTRLRDEARDRGVRLTALAFHVKVLARCLAEFPRFNAALSADGERLILKRYVHVGIAVDTPHGLLVPVIRDADAKGLWAIAAEIGELAARAQARKLGPDEMGGASMTISNLGGIGGTAFTPIVNPPELAILGLTRTEIVPVWDGEAFQPVPMTPLDLSYDHRALNGADAARFLARYANLIANPNRLLV